MATKLGWNSQLGLVSTPLSLGISSVGRSCAEKKQCSGLACGRVTAGAETNNNFTLYLVGSKEQPLQIVVICVDVVPDDWCPLQDGGDFFYRLHRDFVGHHFWTYATQTGKDGGEFTLSPLFCKYMRVDVVFAHQSTECRSQAPASLPPCAGKWTGTPWECKTQRSNLEVARWRQERHNAKVAFKRTNHETLHKKRQQRAALTCGAEQEGGGLPKVPVYRVGDVYLCVGEGTEGLFVGRTHLRLDVVEQQREGAAAKLLHLRPDKGRAAERGSTPALQVSSKTAH